MSRMGKEKESIVHKGVVLALVIALAVLTGACQGGTKAEDPTANPAVEGPQGGSQGIAVGEPNPSAPGFDPGKLTERIEDPVATEPEPAPEDPPKGMEKPAPLEETDGETGAGKDTVMPPGIQGVLPDGFTAKPGEGIVYVYHGGELLGEVDGELILTASGRTREELVVLVDVASLMGMEGKAAVRALDGWLDTGLDITVDAVEVRSEGDILRVVATP